jgi:hypothetical protein
MILNIVNIIYLLIFRIIQEQINQFIFIGFTISLYEYPKTIPTLWNSVKEFMKKYPEYIEKDNLMDFISNDNGENFNLYVIIFHDDFVDFILPLLT